MPLTGCVMIVPVEGVVIIIVVGTAVVGASVGAKTTEKNNDQI